MSERGRAAVSGATSGPLTRIRTAALAGGLAAVVVTGGCFEQWRGKPGVVVAVEGRVHVAGVPVQGGWVEFNPVEGTVGRLRSARIDRDGRFHAKGVARGRNLVRIRQAPAYPPIHPILQSFQTPVRVTAAPGVALEIDLSRPGSVP